MVKLSYSFRLRASFEDVWNYFSRFQNIAQYDPCVKQAKTLSNGSNNIGSKYDVTTTHKGKQSKMIYEVTKYQEKYQQSLRNFNIQLYGSNDRLQSTDNISVREISKNPKDFNLILQYKADICLRGFYWLFTAFAIDTFKEVALNAETKCRTKCIEKWGHDNLKEVRQNK